MGVMERRGRTCGGDNKERGLHQVRAFDSIVGRGRAPAVGECSGDGGDLFERRNPGRRYQGKGIVYQRMFEKTVCGHEGKKEDKPCGCWEGSVGRRTMT